MVALTLCMSAASAQATVPPKLYVNGAEKPITTVCTTELVAEHCPEGKSLAGVRSLYVPLIAWGEITLRAHGLGSKGVKCINTFTGRTWNEHELGNTGKPVRAYGEALGWGTSTCTAPELLASYEEACEGCHPTVFATSEPPLAPEYRQAVICNEHSVKEGRKKLSQCFPAETEQKSLAINTKRNVVSLPWKVEEVRGYDSEGSSAGSFTVQRIGMKNYGECGPGEAEGHQTCSARAENTACYSAKAPNEASWEEIASGCVVTNIVIPQIPAEIPFYGGLEIVGHNGAGSGTDPSYISFEGEYSGHLRSQENHEETGYVEGKEVRELGEEGQELLTIK
jgi:hypothetical protein